VYSDDGSIEIVLSHTEPGTSGSGSGVNWLPVPEGRFVLMLRLYLPRREVIEGDYAYPPIEPFVTEG
jgi:DNA sulfur modification protein DndE